MAQIRAISTGRLRAHPSNSRIYANGDVSDLAESIERQGILEPLVATPERVIVSGHRRLKAAQQLGLKRVPVEIRHFDDETIALIEFNRYRRKTYSEIHRELEIVLPRLRAEAKSRQRTGGRNGAIRKHSLASTQMSRTQEGRTALDEAARLTALSREKVRKLIRIFEARKKRTVSLELIRLLDSEISLHQAYRKILKAQRIQEQRKAIDEETEAGRYEVEDIIRPFDVWSFHFRDRRFGLIDSEAELLASDFGSPPPQVWANLLWYFSEEGDRVIDLTAGSGAFHEVARWMQRKPLSFDIAPKRPFVRRHDMTSGFPRIGAGRPKLILIDPPYGKQKAFSRSKNDLSRCRTVGDYLDAMGGVIESCLPRLAEDGRLAIIIGNESRRGNATDLSWEIRKVLEQHGRVEKRIQVPYPPTHFADYRVSHAKRSRMMLSLTRELFIVRRD